MSDTQGRNRYRKVQPEVREAHVVGQNIVIRKGCKQRVLPLYRILEDGTVYIYPKFRILWSAFIETFYNIYTVQGYPQGDTQTFLFPSPTTGTLTSIGPDENTGFLIFRKVDPSEDFRGPIQNSGVILFVDNNSLDYKVDYIVYTSSPTVISFYNINTTNDIMTLMVDRDNNLTRFSVVPVGGVFSGSTTLYSLSEFAVAIPNLDIANVRVELTVTVQIPNPSSPPPRFECLKFVEKCQKYSLITTITDEIPTFPGFYRSIPSSEFSVLSYLIGETLRITAKPIPLTQMPIPLVRDGPVEVVTCDQTFKYYFYDLVSQLNGYWNAFINPVFTNRPTSLDLRTYPDNDGIANGIVFPAEFVKGQNIYVDLVLTFNARTGAPSGNLGSYYLYIQYKSSPGVWNNYPTRNMITEIFQEVRYVIRDVTETTNVRTVSFIINPDQSPERISARKFALHITSTQSQTDHTADISLKMRVAQFPSETPDWCPTEIIIG